MQPPECQSSPPYLSYWGKAQPHADSQVGWHPVAYHCLDVAAVGTRLFELRPQLLHALAHLSGLQQDLARNWFLFGLALHDIGKFTCCFQAKVEQLFQHKDYWSSGRVLVADPGHGRTGLALWNGDCRGKGKFTAFFGEDSLDTFDARQHFSMWFAAIAGHHGRPVAEENLIGRICPTALEDAAIYIEDCTKLFDPCLPSRIPELCKNSIGRSSWLVAGLAMLCDWIGSNQEWFPYTASEHDLASYMDIALRRAGEALNASGLIPPKPANIYSLSDALGVEKPVATPLQDWASNTAGIHGPSLIVIEDLTGAGKTEAGLIIAHRLMTAGAAEGLYWALPTMATADALYKRIATGYQRLFSETAKASLVLAHSARVYNDIFQKSIFEPKADGSSRYGDGAANDEDTTAGAACTRWLSDDRRKTFLADIGVGTVDQALLSALPSKHQALRLAALCRRVLVIDEAHSYDPYMTGLLETLLEFQGAFGGSAIIISATLTFEARAKLARAFARGAGWQQPHIQELSFPLATVISGGGICKETVLEPSRGTRRDLAIRRLGDETEAMDVLAQASHNGQAAVWIRNTVQDALDAHANLRTMLPEAKVDLFHARFALGDRLEIEKHVLENFGKPSEGAQRQRILIVTQVVEQSLDCDWDVMISDLAPIDLLIQRAGRLHRHHHRPARPDPVLHVVSPDPQLDTKADWYSSAFPRAAYVYPNHAQLWLTMHNLLVSGGLKLASSNPRDLIERVFGVEAEEAPEALSEASANAEAKAMSEGAFAKMNALKLNAGYVHHAGAWESDTKTPTRLGEDSRVLRLAKWDGATLTPWHTDDDLRKAWRLSEVSVRATLVESIDYDANTVLQQAVAKETASWPEKFDPPLLLVLSWDGKRWNATVKNKQGQNVEVSYSSDAGLVFHT